MGAFNARTLALKGKHGLVRTEETIEVCRQRGYCIVGLQEARQDGAECVHGDGTGAEGQHGVGIAIKGSISRDVEKVGLAVECKI